MRVREVQAVRKRGWHRRKAALELFAVAALLVTFSLRYLPFVKAGLLFGPFLDVVHVYAPIFAEVSRLAAAGTVPYYLPCIGTGFPIFESPHFSILYPFYFFGLIDYGGPLASLYTLTNVTLLHIFIFYINLYVLLRCATITPWASYIGASAGLLARNTELYASWITITASYAWLPLVLAGAALLLRRSRKIRGILVFSVAAGLLALASASQSVIHATVACVIIFGTGVAWLIRQRRFSTVRSLIWSLAICGVIAFGLAGAATLPMTIATGSMIRSFGKGAAILGHAQVPWENFNSYQLRLPEAIGILIKPAWISVVGSPYIGPLGFVGALLVAVYFYRSGSFSRMFIVAFALVALYGLLSGFGTNLGLAYLNFHVPLINRIREGGRYFVLFVVGISFLSGVGYMLLVRAIRSYKQTRNARELIVPGFAILLFFATLSWELVYDKDIQPMRQIWMLALGPIILGVGRVFKIAGAEKIGSAALFVSAAALVVPVRGSSVSASEYATSFNLLSHRVIGSVAKNIDSVNYRVEFRDTAFTNQFWAMNASYYGIRSFYNQLTPQPYTQLHFSNLGYIPHLRAMMGARYVLCGPGNSPTDAGAKQLLESEGYRLYENPNPMARLAVVHQTARFPNNEAEFVKILRKGFDYLSIAYIDRDHFEATRDFLGDKNPSSHESDRIERVADQVNRSCSVIESDSASLLILNEWFTPAWKARVNGTKRPVLRVNEWQTGVLLPAGKNRVEFEYQPILFRYLMMVSWVTASLLLCFVAFRTCRNRVG